MKDFIRPRGRLRSLPLSARVVYSVFAVFTLIALAFSAWLANEMVGLDLSRLDSYYAGTAAPLPAPHASEDAGAAAGPTLDLPPEADAPPASEPMPLRKLLEVTHFHLFSMPVYLLILSHLFMLSRVREGMKLAFIALSTLGVAGHLAAPWIARSAAASATFWYASTGALMTIGLLVMTLVPLWEMWIPLKSVERSTRAE